MDFLHIPLDTLVAENPVFIDFFTSFNIHPEKEKDAFLTFVDQASPEFWEDNGIGRHEFTGLFVDFISAIKSSESTTSIESLEILAGQDKSGNPEQCNLSLKPGEVTCIVGPTGSGKSRLLADIEWLANMDTPTKRKIRINGQETSQELLDNFGGKLIAQITQNMNFVLDMDVYSFLMLHAQSRFLPEAEKVVQQVIDLANELSGESFDPNTPVTFLSGGQSRALMIADVACIGMAPIVLIDEIENAGVNKKKALDLLVSQDKIVLMATHDPLLILLADKRVVIKNGAMDKIIETNAHERELYQELKKLDDTLHLTKEFFRHGKELSDINQLI